MQQVSDCEIEQNRNRKGKTEEMSRGDAVSMAEKNCEIDRSDQRCDGQTAEYWDLCDASGINLGEQILRGEPHPPGTYHIVVCVWIWNSKGQVLLTLRSQKKKQFPGLWEGLGGSAQAGETSLESIVREVKEEIGLDFPPGCFVLLKRSLEKTALVDIYELKADFAVEDLKLQTEEVDQAIWATEEELQQIISEGKFSAAALRRWEAVERAD